MVFRASLREGDRVCVTVLDAATESMEVRVVDGSTEGMGDGQEGTGTKGL